MLCGIGSDGKVGVVVIRMFKRAIPSPFGMLILDESTNCIKT